MFGPLKKESRFSSYFSASLFWKPPLPPTHTHYNRLHLGINQEENLPSSFPYFQNTCSILKRLIGMHMLLSVIPLCPVEYVMLCSWMSNQSQHSTWNHLFERRKGSQYIKKKATYSKRRGEKKLMIKQHYKQNQ